MSLKKQSLFNNYYNERHDFKTVLLLTFYKFANEMLLVSEQKKSHPRPTDGIFLTAILIVLIILIIKIFLFLLSGNNFSGITRLSQAFKVDLAAAVGFKIIGNIAEI